MSVCVTPGAQGTARVTVSGEIDLHNAAELRDDLLTAITSYRGTITVDLQPVTFCYCAGLNALLGAHQHAVRAHRLLWISATSPQVDRLLELTGTRASLDGHGSDPYPGGETPSVA